MSDRASAAVFAGVGQPFELRTFPVPVPRGVEVVVQVTACTLCGSDVHSVHGRRTVPTPSILGHEILGRIVAFGPDAKRHDFAGQPLQIGDRVTWAIVASCGNCFYCQRDLPQKCEYQTKYGHEPLRPGYELTGGLADHCWLAPGTAILHIPEELSDSVACPANCATATVAAAMRLAGDLKGRRVLIMGAGMLGVTATAWASAHHADEVICCDVDPSRLANAEAFGATRLTSPETLAAVVADCTSKHGVDITIELTGAPEAFETALPLSRLGASVILIGSVFPTRPTSLLLEQIVRRCLTLRGNHNYAAPDLQEAIAFLTQHHAEFPFDSLVARWFPLSDVASAFAVSPKEALRVGIRNDN